MRILMGSARSGPRKHELELPKLGTVKVYAGELVGKALEEVTEDMDFYHGVKLTQVLEAVYEQGRKDGRRQVFDGVRDLSTTGQLNYRNPGRPKK
jgi:hypothetical protein